MPRSQSREEEGQDEVPGLSNEPSVASEVMEGRPGLEGFWGPGRNQAFSICPCSVLHPQLLQFTEGD